MHTTCNVPDMNIISICSPGAKATSDEQVAQASSGLQPLNYANGINKRCEIV